MYFWGSAPQGRQNSFRLAVGLLRLLDPLRVAVEIRQVVQRPGNIGEVGLPIRIFESSS